MANENQKFPVNDPEYFESPEMSINDIKEFGFKEVGSLFAATVDSDILVFLHKGIWKTLRMD